MDLKENIWLVVVNYRSQNRCFHHIFAQALHEDFWPQRVHMEAFHYSFHAGRLEFFIPQLESSVKVFFVAGITILATQIGWIYGLAYLTPTVATAIICSAVAFAYVFTSCCLHQVFLVIKVFFRHIAVRSQRTFSFRMP